MTGRLLLLEEVSGSNQDAILIGVEVMSRHEVHACKTHLDPLLPRPSLTGPARDHREGSDADRNLTQLV